MQGEGRLLVVTTILTLLQLVFNKELTRLCHERLYAVPGDPQFISHATVSSMLFSHGATYCKYEIYTKAGNMIRVQLKTNLTEPKGQETDPDCNENYIYIGNDRVRVGVDMMTSYKLCRSTQDQEIVSRGNYLWVIIQSREPAVFSGLRIHYQAKLPVPCNNTLFSCSPVQCVPRTSLCDGHVDCDNARDEYCAARLGEVLTPYRKLEEPCFLCGDGTCISPALPRYSLDWGKQLWYLCDGYSHCDDGTDERKDVCYRIKGRATALFHCVPKSLNLTARMWDIVLCDGTVHCEGGQDESTQLCDKETDTTNLLNPVAVVIPIAALMILVVGVLIGRSLYNTQTRQLSSPAACLDTLNAFAELSNGPSAQEWKRSSSVDHSSEVENDYIDNNADIQEESSADEETVFDVSSVRMQTSV